MRLFQLLSNRFEIRFFFRDLNASKSRVVGSALSLTLPSDLDSIYASALGRIEIRSLGLTFLGFHDLRALYSGVRWSDVFVSSNIWNTYSLIGLVLCKLFNRRIIIWEEWNVFFPEFGYKILYTLLRLLCVRVDAFFVLGEAQKNFLMKLGVEAERVFVADEYPGYIYSEVDPREIALPFDKNTSIVLYMGRFVEMKGVEYLIRAFGIVEGKRDDAALLIVGYGPLKEHLEAVSRRLGIKRVYFAGDIADMRVRAYLLRKSSMLVVPSIIAKTSPRHEGGPSIVLEGLSAGTPVITTNASGASFAYIKDGVNGYQVPQRDVVDLADKIMRLLDVPIMPAQVLSTFREIKGHDYQAEQLQKAVSYSLRRKVSQAMFMRLAEDHEEKRGRGRLGGH